METEEEFAQEIREAAESVEIAPQPDRAARFYDRLRKAIRGYVDKKAGVLGKTADFLLLVPDVFILLWRLTTDSRVVNKDKVLLGSAIAYFIFPFDIIPEALMGPMGFLDDLVFGVFVLNKMLTTTDVEVLREHWSGSDDVLASIQRVLNAADSLVGSNMVGKIKKMMGS
jgi:uncharacterized membrane protein YkvA (DUF1232 family)